MQAMRRSEARELGPPDDTTPTGASSQMTMKRYRGVAFAVVRPAALVIVAGVLILVVLPAVLGAQAAAIR